jgi:hypothetical protein
VIETTPPSETLPAAAIAWALVRAAATAAARASFCALTGSPDSKEMPLTLLAPLAVAASTTSPALSRSRTVTRICSLIW